MEMFEGKPIVGTISDLTRFVLLRKIAEGGMGTIYEALQLGAEGFRKTMAIKMIREEFSDDEEFVTMFIEEAKLVADLVSSIHSPDIPVGKSRQTVLYGNGVYRWGGFDPVSGEAQGVEEADSR